MPSSSSSDEHSSHESNPPQYPRHYLLAVIDDAQQADAAAQALQTAGFAREDISVFHGTEGLTAIQAQQASEGIWGKLFRAFMGIEGGEVRSRFEDELRRWASDIFVHLNSPEQQQRAEEVLRQHHGYLLTVLGPYTWEQLPAY